MINDIVDLIAAEVYNTGYFTSVGGAATSVAIRDENTIRILPSAKEIVSGQIKTFVPDDSETGLAFFEVGESRVARSMPRAAQLYADARLVFWLNSNKINGNPGQISRDLLRILNFSAFEIQGVSGVSVTFLSEEKSGPTVFSSYSIDESEHHLCYPPYYAGALRFKITYVISKSCIPVMSTGSTNC